MGEAESKVNGEADAANYFIWVRFPRTKMGEIHLLGSNLHVMWICLTYIVLSAHILSTLKLLLLKKKF